MMQELGAVVLDGGLLYVADTGHHRVLECGISRAPDGWPRVRLLRVFGRGEPGLADGPVATAAFRSPQGMARHGKVLYVADTGNHAVRAIDLATATVRTLAGTGRRGARKLFGRPQLDRPGKIELRSPWDVDVLESKGEPIVFVAMAGSHQIWCFGLGHAGIFAGSGASDHVDGPAMTALLGRPSGLALFGRYLLFADADTGSIRGVDLQHHQVVTVIGQSAGDTGDVDGPSEQARLQQPLSITFGEDTVYVADTLNHKVKRISLAQIEARTVVGGDPSVLCEPGGIDRLGDYLVVADTGNHRLRVVHPKTGEIRDLPVS